MKKSSMTVLVEEYLNARRRLGFALEVDGRQLQRFANFTEKVGHKGPLTLELAVQWARSDTTRQITSARRIETLRPFAKYLSQFDPATEIPPTKLLGTGHRRLVPHIYFESEIRSLLAAAAHLPPEGGLRPKTYQFFFGLLAVTGMRLSEALHLSREDIDLDTGILTVREAKFHKSRLVPLHQTTIKALRQYDKFRCSEILFPSSDHFFLLDNGCPLRRGTVEYRFQKLREQLRWRARGGHPAPRIQDLRHTFVCGCLLRWYREGLNIDREILALSTYVGHVKVTDTYWYITGVPVLMAAAAKRFEKFSQGGAL